PIRKYKKSFGKSPLYKYHSLLISYFCNMENSPVAFYQTEDQKALLAFGLADSCEFPLGNALNSLQDFVKKHAGSYLFMALPYDLKNEIENLSSQNFDGSQFPELICWKPSCVVSIEETQINWLQGEKNKKADEFIQL